MSDVLPSAYDIPARAGTGDVAFTQAEAEFQLLSRRVAEKMVFAAQLVEQEAVTVPTR